MIDWKRVETLREEVGPEDFDEVVELFLEEVDAVVDRLSAGFKLSSLEEDLHFLKGSALSLGFRDFSNLCQIGETAAANAAPETVDMTEILDCYTASRSFFLSQIKQKLAG